NHNWSSWLAFQFDDHQVQWGPYQPTGISLRPLHDDVALLQSGPVGSPSSADALYHDAWLQFGSDSRGALARSLGGHQSEMHYDQQAQSHSACRPTWLLDLEHGSTETHDMYP